MKTRTQQLLRWATVWPQCTNVTERQDGQRSDGIGRTVEPLLITVRPKTKKKARDAQRNGPVMKSVESVLEPEESLWWERSVKDVGFEPEVKK